MSRRPTGGTGSVAGKAVVALAEEERLVVLIPARDEASTITDVVSSFRSAAEALVPATTVLVVDDRSRAMHAATGLVVERGQLGSWIVGEAGAVLVRRHRVYCYCVKATGGGLPACDRLAHLLLALRCDERDFATVANLAFSGAPWRLRRRLRANQRDALRAALQTSQATRNPAKIWRRCG